MIELGTAYAADSLKLQKAFARLAEKAQDGIMRPILTAASKVVAEAERQAAPQETGLLREAIGASATRTYKSAGSTKLFIAAGVRWGFRRNVARNARGKLKFDRKSRPVAGERNARDPAKYLGPVTKGHGAAAADRFIEETYRRIAPQLQTTIAAQGQAAIQREFAT